MNWISAEERLPENKGEVIGDEIFITDGKDIWIGYYYEAYDELGVFARRDGSLIYDEIITHWMPFPELPDKEQK